jgi:hypothetical protein
MLQGNLKLCCVKCQDMALQVQNCLFWYCITHYIFLAVFCRLSIRWYFTQVVLGVILDGFNWYASHMSILSVFAYFYYIFAEICIVPILKVSNCTYVWQFGFTTAYWIYSKILYTGCPYLRLNWYGQVFELSTWPFKTFHTYLQIHS